MIERIVLTGGPGAGKTTVLEALAAQGMATRREAGRAVIRAQSAAGGDALPWGNRLAFARAMAEIDRSAWGDAAPGRTVYDRGLIDVIGYLRLEALTVPDDLATMAAAHRYDSVLILPPWPAIYATDAERRQTPEIAERTCAVMDRTYRDFGYAPIEVPRGPVAARAAFILGLLR